MKKATSILFFILGMSIIFAVIDKYFATTISGLIFLKLETIGQNQLGIIPLTIISIAIVYVAYILFFGRRHLFDTTSLQDILNSFKAYLSSFLNKYSKRAVPELIEEEKVVEEEEEKKENNNIHEEIMKGLKNTPPVLAYTKDDMPIINTNKNLYLDFVMPPFDILSLDGAKGTGGDTKAKGLDLQKTLHNFGIAVEMYGTRVGPSVTRYTLKPAQGVNVRKILGLKDNLQMSVSATNMHIEAPIPGQPFVGIEIPNEKKQQLGLRTLIDNEVFLSSGKLNVAIGRDIIGNAVYGNIEDMPHLLIAGATKSGKSVTVQNLIVSLLYKNSPDDLKMIIIDPKRVEFTIYKNLPHLGTPVLTDAKSAVKALN
ncbi:MAG: DNA translocase FtsK [Candidatus Pacebacteria bacterium]|nr:DNA translocase FtsK [Candidatus Paceibacterota bacterium]